MRWRLEQCSSGGRQRIRKEPSRRVLFYSEDYINNNLQRYGALGFSLLNNNYQPIPVRGKQPLIKKWTRLPITKEGKERIRAKHLKHGEETVEAKAERSEKI